jgi:hypothetical protein
MRANRLQAGRKDGRTGVAEVLTGLITVRGAFAIDSSNVEKSLQRQQTSPRFGSRCSRPSAAICLHSEVALVRAKPVLGGLHHEYAFVLMPAGCRRTTGCAPEGRWRLLHQDISPLSDGFSAEHTGSRLLAARG